MAKKVIQWVAPFVLTASMSCLAGTTEEEIKVNEQFEDIFKRGRLMLPMYMDSLAVYQPQLWGRAMAKACNEPSVGEFSEVSPEKRRAFYRKFIEHYPRDQLPPCFENNCALDETMYFVIGVLVEKAYVEGYLARVRENLEEVDVYKDQCEEIGKFADELSNKAANAD